MNCAERDWRASARSPPQRFGNSGIEPAAEAAIYTMDGVVQAIVEAEKNSGG